MKSKNNKYQNIALLMEKYESMSDNDFVDVFLEAESTVDRLEYCINNNDTNIPQKKEIGAACFYLWVVIKKELSQKDDLDLIEDLLAPEKGVVIISNFQKFKRIRDDAILSLHAQRTPIVPKSSLSLPVNLDDIYF